MSSLTSVTLKTRRQTLQNQRRLKYWQTIWRSLVACGLATGLFWAIALPEWAIERETQIEIEGNQFLSEAELRQLLALAYPQPILKLQSQQVAQKLKANAPVEEAAVTRQLFPPQLTIHLKERPPVAILSAPNAPSDEIGFLDAQGISIPKDFYAQMDQARLPTLKVIGFTKQYQPYWSELYRLVSRSPVQIKEVNWQNPSNLILKTELGIVHLGANPEQWSEQMTALSRLQSLSTHVNSSQIAKIDLTNPRSPTIELIESAEEQPSRLE